ncbi:phosphoribosylanthranilate isomerase [Lihuaxuella thermophila]|uniref:N-(5'-phosphoribosyl)anthranilate isomerase n=1 Tax=Lihuaxuella thermophila TaxID=1173111 RepID=A0A1H8F8P3_9BACL|nr:phosphoribosylanthranilate isomerase [Lihuaxuella thermophila]SEN28193.1 phosphoribosylanthranilate isomerase [Lihuaxuella thermophila]
MKRTNIKLCGFRTPEDVEKVEGIPVDAIGFILVPGRKRSVRPEQIAVLVDRVPPGVLTVGVLINPSLEEIDKWLSLAPLQAIQLHGEETASFCRSIKERFSVRVIKTFHVDEQMESPCSIKEYSPWVDVALLDSGAGQIRGGTGTTFDWEQISLFRKECRSVQIPLWVAGGLNEQNVEALIRAYAPDGVDVSSGIESDGEKDRQKMKRFVERVVRSGQTAHSV